MMKKLAQLAAVLIILSMSLPLPVQAEGVYTISGKVTTAGGSALAGVTIALGSINATTDSGGSYTITDVPAGTSGSLTPSKDGYTFDPASRAIDNVTDNINGQDFTAAPLTYSLSGKISSTDGKGLEGISVVFGELKGTTGSNGAFTIKDVPAGASGSLTPSKDGYTFDPVGRSIESITADLTAQDFSAAPQTYSLSGTISTPDGKGLQGVKVVFGSLNATTGSNGAYTITNVPAGASGSPIPSKDGFTFTPTNVNAASVTDNLSGQNFIATQTITYTITGTITTSGSVPLAGVVVSLGSHHSLATGNTGIYTIANVPAGTKGSLTPSRAGYSFTPHSIPVESLGGDLPGQDFSAGLLTFTVSGKISGWGVHGVTISDGITSTSPDLQGNYSFAGVPYGTKLVLTPTEPGYAFEPEKIWLSAIKSNQTGNNFISTIFRPSIKGTVTSGGLPLAGVLISNGTISTRTTTSGNYTLTHIPYGSTYNLTPSLKNYIFSPPFIAVSNQTTNLIRQNFTASLITYTITGTVTTSSGGLLGVKVSLNSTYSALTDGTGTYTISGVPIGTTGTLSAFLPAYKMSPASITVPSLQGNLAGQNFSATSLPVTYSLSGQITIENPFVKPEMVGFPGVTILLGQYSAITASDGTYTIDKIAPGTAGLLTPTITGFTLSPMKRTILPLNSTRSGLNFTVTHTDYTIYGQILTDTTGRQIDHVKIHISANGIPVEDDMTDSSGFYFLRNLPNGVTYLITPEKVGYTFSPSSITIPVLAKNSRHDFKGTLLFENISGTVSGLLPNTTIQIRYGSGSTQFAITDGNGGYQITNLPQSAAYTLTPISPLPPLATPYRFSPTSLTFPAGSTGTTTANFQATPQVVMSGTITVQNKPVQGATISLAEYSFISTKTDAYGKYSLWVPSNLSITPTITHPYFTFTDVIAPNSYTAAFTPSWTHAEVVVTGNVSLNGTGLGSVTISASPLKGSTPVPVQTAPGTGAYQLIVQDTDTANLASFVVTPALTGYTFSPPSRLVNPATGTVRNFTAIPNH